jgi:hypothetical protein
MQRKKIERDFLYDMIYMILYNFIEFYMILYDFI